MYNLAQKSYPYIEPKNIVLGVIDAWYLRYTVNVLDRYPQLKGLAKNMVDESVELYTMETIQFFCCNRSQASRFHKRLRVQISMEVYEDLYSDFSAYSHNGFPTYNLRSALIYSNINKFGFLPQHKKYTTTGHIYF
ncbi:hypothetical protein D3C76_1506660 [compost metagenome]